jgi:hypothetical protein
VRPRIERALQVFNGLKVVIFEPGGGPSESGANRSTAVPDMTPGRAALVGLMDRYLRGLLDPFVTLLEVHKLMYFMQEAGEPLRLKYSKGPYGPYAENLRHVLHAVEGHFVAGYLDGGDAPDKHLALVPGAVDEATAFLASEQETLARYERVSELVEGFESPFGLELLSTVHWIAGAEPDLSLEEVTEQVYSWSDRKKQFSRRQIGVAIEVLARRGWIEREDVSGG